MGRRRLLLALSLVGCRAPMPSEDTAAASTSATLEDSTIAATTGSGGDTTGSDPFGPTDACLAFLACIEAHNPEQLEMAQAAYGPGAACWTRGPQDAAICDESCAVALDVQCEGERDTEPSALLACALSTVAPGVTSPIASGRDVGDVPLAIAAIFESHCGCHLVDDPRQLVEGTPPYLGPLSFRTQAELHATIEGTIAWQHIRLRSIEEQNMPPVYHCGMLEFGSLPGDDYATLAAWLDAGAPDAARWTP